MVSAFRTEADLSVTSAVSHIKILKSIFISFPLGISVRNVDPIPQHFLLKDLFIVAKWTFYKVTSSSISHCLNTLPVEPSFTAGSPERGVSTGLERHPVQADSTLTNKLGRARFGRLDLAGGNISLPIAFWHPLLGSVITAVAVKVTKELAEATRTETAGKVETLVTCFDTTAYSSIVLLAVIAFQLVTSSHFSFNVIAQKSKDSLIIFTILQINKDKT